MLDGTECPCAPEAAPGVGPLFSARATQSPRSGRNAVEDPAGVDAVSTWDTMGHRREWLISIEGTGRAVCRKARGAKTPPSNPLPFRFSGMATKAGAYRPTIRFPPGRGVARGGLRRTRRRVHRAAVVRRTRQAMPQAEIAERGAMRQHAPRARAERVGCPAAGHLRRRLVQPAARASTSP